MARNSRPTFEMDPSKQFPHLNRAPIVEAVIHWRARSGMMPQCETLRERLKGRLPDYRTPQSQQEVEFEGQIGLDGASHAQRARWLGFRLESADGLYIAQFTRNGFVFSRLAPYEDWGRFAEEAKRLWQIHVELTEPSEIERLGVRFINRIAPVDLDALDEILTLPPRCPGPLQLPLDEFLHRSRFDVPGRPYRLNIIQTAQLPTPPGTDALGLILDIDVFTTATVPLDDEALDHHLAEMRWLKNEAFYSLLTPQAVKRFGEVQ